MVSALREKIIDGLLAAMQVSPWAQITLIDVAAHAGLPLATVVEHFDSKQQVIAAYGARLDKAVAANLPAMRHDESCRDRLFDIMMERYELLADNRGAVRALFQAVRFDASEALTALPHLQGSIKQMLTLAEIESTGVRGAVRLLGVTAVYLRGVQALVHDDSADLSKVMARLDHDLARAEWLSNLLVI